MKHLLILVANVCNVICIRYCNCCSFLSILLCCNLQHDVYKSRSSKISFNLNYFLYKVKYNQCISSKVIINVIYFLFFSFLYDIQPSIQYHVVPIIDPFGPSITVKDLQCIVVSQETLKGGNVVNEERLKKVSQTN